MIAPARPQVAVLLGCATALALACGDEVVNPLGTGGAGSTAATTSTGASTSSAGGSTSQGGMGGMLGMGGFGMGGLGMGGLGMGGLGMGGMTATGGMGGMPGAGGAGGGLVPVLVPDFAILDANPNSTTSGQLVSPRDHLGRVSAWYFGHST
jgi:hypothetical protein